MAERDASSEDSSHDIQHDAPVKAVETTKDMDQLNALADKQRKVPQAKDSKPQPASETSPLLNQFDIVTSPGTED